MAEQQPQPQYSRPQHHRSRSTSRNSASRSSRNRSTAAARRGNDVGGLPSFITGGQPQQAPQYVHSNGHDGQGDRFHRRRRRHRGPHNPRQDVRSDAPPEPGNE